MKKDLKNRWTPFCPGKHNLTKGSLQKQACLARSNLLKEIEEAPGNFQEKQPATFLNR